MTPLFLDFETQSPVDLKKQGGRVYAKHSATRVLCLCAQLGDVSYAYVPRSTCWKMPDFADDGTRIERSLDSIKEAAKRATHLVAHNANTFDRYLWDRFVGIDKPWIDTIDLVRQAGLPASLDDLGVWFTGKGKDPGKETLKKLMKLEWDGKKWVNKYTLPGAVATVVRYCLHDVRGLLQTIYNAVKDFPFESEQVPQWAYTMNQRGVGFDEDLASKIATISTMVIKDSMDEIERIAPEWKGKNLKSHVVVRKWMEDRGVRLKNLRKENVERFIDDPDGYMRESLDDDDEYAPEGIDCDDVVLRVLRLRQSCLRITGAKLERASSICEHGRLHDLSVYGGAHTLRFSSRLFQVQNMPRGVEGLDIKSLTDDLTYEKVREEAGRLGCSPDDVLSSLIRPTLIPTKGHHFFISDYASIESRVVAWIAGQGDWLQLFRNDGDPYKLMASQVFGVPYDEVTKEQRKIAKPLVLGGVYGLGKKQLGVYSKAFGVNLEKVGLDPEFLINQFRSSCPKIAGEYGGEIDGEPYRTGGLWKDFKEAFKNVVLYDAPRTVGKCRFSRYDSGVMVRLPSGRCLMYRKAAVEQVEAPWGGVTDVLYYTGGRGRQRLHGGIMTENIVQAIARDIMVDGALRIEDRGLPVVFTTHDEIIGETPISRCSESLEIVTKIMSTPPEWAEDLPLAAEGFTSPRYAKEKYV